jgi:type IV pilus assembly protein PilX
MKQSRHAARCAQHGVVLISSLLLLLVVTIMALSMFRSFGMQERIAGNMREKQRAVQAANSAQQYAEWWLANQSGATFAVSQGSAVAADVVCANTLIDANATPGAAGGQICTNTLVNLLGVTPAAWPSSANWNIGVVYTPPIMNVTNLGQPDYYPRRPHFYIADVGPLVSARGEVYQVDAYSMGLTTSAIAVVESTVAITCVVCNVGGL